MKQSFHRQTSSHPPDNASLFINIMSDFYSSVTIIAKWVSQCLGHDWPLIGHPAPEDSSIETSRPRQQPHHDLRLAQSHMMSRDVTSCDCWEAELRSSGSPEVRLSALLLTGSEIKTLYKTFLSRIFPRFKPRRQNLC